MTSRERIKAALGHKETDRVPIDLGATSVTGISASALSKLRGILGLKSDMRIKINEPYQMLGEVDDDVRAVLGIDTISLSPPRNLFGFENTGWKPWELFDGTSVLVPEKFNTESESDGSILMYPEGDRTAPPSGRMPKEGFYFDTIVRQQPIDEDNLNPEDNLEEFKPISDENLEYFRKESERLYTSTDFAIIATFGGMAFGDIALVPAPFLKFPKGIRDVEEWYISTMMRRGYVYEVFERQCEIALKNLERIRQAVSNRIEAVFITGTDFGTQTSQFVSRDTYRELYKPFHKKVNDWVHANTTWKSFIHSCGAVEPLISEFIDAGFDILNPVQCSAACMEPDLLKERYGKNITFWGGGVDTQKTLPFGTQEEIRNEVKERLKIFSKGGGFVFNTVHNIQAKTPSESIIAMFETVKNFKIGV